jgi:hypothetical protein
MAVRLPYKERMVGSRNFAAGSRVASKMLRGDLMTLVPHCKRLILSVSAMAVLALPSLAATPARRHPSNPPNTVTISGVVIDATTSKPVPAA